MQCPITEVAELLPHSGNMVVFKTIESYDEESLKGNAYIPENSPLADNGYFSSWAAMEVMAQGIGALAGALSTDAGEEIRLGFLLGTRRLELFFDKIPLPCQLEVSVQQSIQDSNGFGVFDCTLSYYSEEKMENILLAKAALNAFQPSNIEEYLNH